MIRSQCYYFAALVLSSASVFAFAPGGPTPKRLSSALSMAGTTSEAANQNIFGVISDAATGAAFSFLHLADDTGVQDSSKNLRVLWVRALLSQKGRIRDDVAATLLPKATRNLVCTDAGAALFDPILQFTEWIQARTEFIDTALDRFLQSPVCTCEKTGKPLECNVVLFGAGYDTRALRYRHAHGGIANFIEVDLPAVVEGKQRLYEKFQRENDPEWDFVKDGSSFLPMDLNTCGGDTPVLLIESLKAAGLKVGVPTFFVWEAVLFYVNEDAVRNILQELFSFAQPDGNGGAETMLCFTGTLYVRYWTA
jgi:O-methyltransferase involved in polyketide biosynthesis